MQRLPHRITRTLPLLLSGITALAACRDTNHPFQKDFDSVPLTVLLEDEATGSHQSGTTYHPVGSKIPYEFRTKTEAQGMPYILFLNDGKGETAEYLPASGELVIKAPSSLFVGVDQVGMNLAGADSSPDQRIVAALVDSISNTLAKAVSENSVENTIKLFRHLSRDSITRHHMRDAINTIRLDSSKAGLLSRLEDLMAGQYMEISRYTPDTSPPNPIPPIEKSAIPTSPKALKNNNLLLNGLSTEPIKILHINGILTDPLSALESATEISRFMERSRWKFTFPYQVLLFYNPSSKYPPANNNTNTENYRTGKLSYECFVKITLLRGISTVTIPLHLARCLGKTVKQFFARYDDIREAAVQYIQLQLGIHLPHKFALQLADSISLWRNRGDHVMIIPHSQGNMMTQEAVTELILKNRIIPWQDSTCVMAVSVAAPTSGSWQLNEERFSGIVSKGDIILALNGNHFPQIETQYYRDALRKVERLKGSNDGLYYIKRLLLGVEMHNFVDGYMARSEVTDKISESIANLYERCALGAVDVSPDYSYVALGANLTGNITLKNLRGEKLLGTRSISWSQTHSNPRQPGTRLYFSSKDLLRHTPLIEVINEGISIFTASSGRATGTMKVESYLPGDWYYGKVLPASTWPPT